MAKTTKPAKTSSRTGAAPGRKTAGSRTMVPAASPASGSSAPAIDIGIATGDRKKIADGLSHFLADAYTL